MPSCANCGRDISPAARACPQCGHPGPVAAPFKRTEGFAIASLACSISGFAVAPIFGSILGIAFSKMARKRIASDPTLEGENLARAGRIIGWVGLVLMPLAITFAVLIVLAFSGDHVVHERPAV